MSDYRMIHDDELMHYGVPGMRWGHRKANPYAARAIRDHAGLGKYATRKRQLAGDKRDLEYLNNGGHLSVGYTKKRQADYDARDRRALEKRISKNENIIKLKTEKAQAKKEYKQTDEYKAKRAKAIKVGAAAAGTALAAYGAYKVSKIAKQKYSEQLADKIIREYGHESIRSYNMFVKDTASRVKTKEAVVGLAKFSNEKKRIAKYKERLAKEAVKRAQNDAQMEYIKRMIGNQKSNRAYY